MADGPFTTEELMKLVVILSNRYRGYSHKADLQQEAYVAYYEAIETGNVCPNALTTLMRKAMSAYANYKSSPVRVPSGSNTQKYMRKLSTEEFDKLTPTGKALYQSLHTEVFDIGDYEDKLADDEMSAVDKLIIKNAFDTVLDERDKRIITGMLYSGDSAQKLSEELDISTQRVYEIYKSRLEKLKKVL
jgi:RNA polymerase sigma factor (sigma-70 family)